MLEEAKDEIQYQLKKYVIDINKTVKPEDYVKDFDKIVKDEFPNLPHQYTDKERILIIQEVIEYLQNKAAAKKKKEKRKRSSRSRSP